MRRAAVLILLGGGLGVLALTLAGRQRGPRYPSRPSDSPGMLVAAIQKARPAAERAWPGYRAFDQPLLLATAGSGSLLLGAARLPAGFSRASWSKDSVFVSTRTFVPRFSYVNDFVLDGTTVTAMRFDPRRDGPLNAVKSMRYFLHERFHARQEPPFFHWDETPVKYPVEDARDAALARLENKALARWLSVSDDGALRDFAALRLRRRRLFPGTSVENQEERVEGTAKFVEMAALDTAWSPGATRRLLAQDLTMRANYYALHKWRHYSIGAALCRGLDAWKIPDWRKLVQDGKAPSELVIARLGVREDEVERRVGALTAGADYRALFEDARRDIDQARAQREQWLAEYDALKGRRLVLVSSAALAGFQGDWLDYPDGSKLLVVSEWTVERPEVKVRLGRDKAVLVRGDSAEFVVPPDARVVLDGKPWAFQPGRKAFAALTIDAPPLVSLGAGPGILDDDGKKVRLKFPDAR